MVWAAQLAFPQRLLGPAGVVRLHNEDLAVLAAGQERRDLPCSVSPARPMLGFDLRFHATYDVAVPYEELSQGGDELRILFRVKPVEPAGSERYFVQRVEVPSGGESPGGYAYLHGVFDLGQGSYQVDWLMRDRAGRVCASFWQVEASLPENYRDVQLAIRPGEVAETEFERFQQEPPVLRYDDASSNLHVKVLLNFSPQQEGRATISPRDTSALMAVLRTISRDPRVGRFSVTVFNVQQRRVLYRQAQAASIDFPAIGSALDGVQFATIDLAALADPHGDTLFLLDLLQKELPDDTVDAVVIVGPKAFLSQELSRAELERLRGSVRCPVYYVNYVVNPFRAPWRDTIGNAVRNLGGQEFTISRPGDLWRAVVRMVSEISKARASRQLANASGGRTQ